MDASDILVKLGLGEVVGKIGRSSLIMVMLLLTIGIVLIWQGASTVSSEQAKKDWGYRSFFRSQIIKGIMSIIAAIALIIALILRGGQWW
jgi:UPF0716 family protein affecting phage T7 exclusion